MPDQEIITTDEETLLLERVRQQQGLASVEQAAEWLAKSFLRKQAKRISGRGRALYDIERKPS
jgi:hypothetical protein